jgi:hypothetical protein
MLTKEQAAALDKLEQGTHVFWNPKGVQMLTEPFGFKGKVFTEYANPKDPKGLTFDNGAKSAEGADSISVSNQILDHYNLTAEHKLGRGFQVRVNVEAIREHLSKPQPKKKSRSKK